MIACFDVHYHDDHCIAAAVVFHQWNDLTSTKEHVIRCDVPKDYVAGEFYKRELAPLLAVIAEIDSPVHTYVVDAYCHLSADNSPGLGAHLQQALKNDAAIIGVAKNRFRDTRHAVELMRGGSSRPLFVTAIGLPYETAANQIASMHGPHRMPTLLKRVDRLSRDGGAA